MASINRSMNIEIPKPPKRERSMSLPSTPNKERSLSEQFDILSYESKHMVLSMCGGVKPTSTIKEEKRNTEDKRIRINSADLSPVTKSILQFHGIKNR